jgi:hypothetical protein
MIAFACGMLTGGVVTVAVIYWYLRDAPTWEQ